VRKILTKGITVFFSIFTLSTLSKNKILNPSSAVFGAGQLSHLSSKGCGAGPMEISADEDVLADSNFASLFDSSTEQGATATAELPAPSYHDNHWASAGTMTTHGCQSRIGPRLSVNMDLLNETSLFPAASDDNVDSTNEFMRNAEVSMVDDSVNHGPMPAVSEAVLDVGCGDCVAQLSHERTEPSNVALQSLSSNGSSHPSRRSTTLHVRRRSDPGSLNSSTTTRSSSLSLSVSSSHNSAENWYYVDRRLRPGGELAAQYGRSVNHSVNFRLLKHARCYLYIAA